MVVSEVLIDPDFTFALIVKSDEAIIDSHGSAFLVSGFKALERSIQNVERFRVSQLRGVNESVGDSLCNNGNMVVGVFYFLVLARTLWRLLEL